MADRKTLLLTILLSVVVINLALQCLDERGSPVDWFIVYKLPKSTHKHVNGMEYFYMDVNKKFHLSDHSIDKHGNAVFNTLQQIYQVQNDSLLYAMYNDEPPKSAGPAGYVERGHTKGVIGFDTNRGFWMIHSVPHFPGSLNDGYSWPHSAYRYAQDLFCISFSSNTIDKIGEVFLYNYPKFYDHNVPDWVNEEHQTMVKALDSERVKCPPWYSIVKLNSVGNQTFTSFSKAGKFGQDLYAGLVAPYLKSNLYTETWLNGIGRLKSNCSLKYHVQNIVSMALPHGMNFTDSNDHSKWAVSVNNTDYWVCIGDMNRERPQMYRGGGTVCFQNKTVWKNYRNNIIQVEQCG